jgi:hypothetical protein
MRRPDFACLWLLPLALLGCDGAAPEDLGESDRVQSQRVALDAGGGAGGAGGQAGASDDAQGAVPVCFPEIVTADDGLPECFVAEVSERPLDCAAPGREPLRPEWEDAARDAECAARGLEGADCSGLALCGLVKLSSGAGLTSCAAGTPTEPGYCLLERVSPECSATLRDALLVAGTAAAPVASSADSALQVFCAVTVPGGEPGAEP